MGNKTSRNATVIRQSRPKKFGGAPSALQEDMKSHSIAATSRRNAILTIDDLIKKVRPTTLILHQPEFNRECFYRFDFIQRIFVLVPIYAEKKDIRALQEWYTMSLSDARITILVEDDALLTVYNAFASEYFRQEMTKNKKEGNKTMYIGIDVSYYTAGQEFGLLNVGDICVNVA